MKAKITALVFGILALALEVFLSITNPTVESVVAAVFATVIVVSVIAMMVNERVVTITEDMPKDSRANSKVLKLSNEIAPYIKTKDGKITIKVVK